MNHDTKDIEALKRHIEELEYIISIYGIRHSDGLIQEFKDDLELCKIQLAEGL